MILVSGRDVLLDQKDWALFRGKMRLHIDTGGYVQIGTRRDKRSFWWSLHRVITNAPSGMDVDHINGNRLDNRRCNLRLATRQQNIANQRLSSRNKVGLKGVYRYKGGVTKPFAASIKVSGKRTFLGCFATAEEAHMAYCEAADRLFGEFACYG
jgi:hypothetical protein